MIRSVDKAILAALAVLHFGAAVWASNEIEARTDTLQVPLIQLFSSEGCSSCPPADDWLSERRDDTGLWKKFVPIAMHVDYWDSLGWKDPYASAANTNLQQRLARENKRLTIYTPAFFKAGLEWRPLDSPPGKRESRVDEPAAAKVGVLSLKQTGATTFEARFRPEAGGSKNAQWVVHAALLGNGLKSEVARGENEGRFLRHEFVALQTREVSMRLAAKAGEFVAVVEFTKPQTARPNSWSLALWVTEGTKEKPVQALGLDWPRAFGSNLQTAGGGLGGKRQ